MLIAGRCLKIEIKGGIKMDRNEEAELEAEAKEADDIEDVLGNIRAEKALEIKDYLNR